MSAGATKSTRTQNMATARRWSIRHCFSSDPGASSPSSHFVGDQLIAPKNWPRAKSGGGYEARHGANPRDQMPNRFPGGFPGGEGNPSVRCPDLGDSPQMRILHLTTPHLLAFIGKYLDMSAARVLGRRALITERCVACLLGPNYKNTRT
jgi:hypothetical protein